MSAARVGVGRSLSAVVEWCIDGRLVEFGMRTYLDIEVEMLNVVGPRSTRRFLLAERATFFDLHEAIQAATPWENRHLFSFSMVGRRAFGHSPHDPDSPKGSENVTELPVKQLLREEFIQCCLYNYDYGDDWWVLVRDHERVKMKETFFRRLISGEGTWVPEDCMGPPGFRDLLARSVVEAFDFERVKGEFDRARKPALPKELRAKKKAPALRLVE